MLRSWNREDGLPAADVQAIARTPDGYLWIGTTRGLTRFDGVRFVTLTTDNTVGLPDNRITSLLASRSGELWIGTESGSLVRRREGRFEAVAFGVQGRRINALAEDSKGDVWIGTRGAGVARWHDGNLEFFTRTKGLPAEGVAQLLAEPTGRIWAISGGRLMLFQDGRWQDAAEFSSVRLPVVALARARDGGIWVGTAADAGGQMGSQIFKVKGGVASESAPYPWPQNTFHTKLRALFEDSDGRLWAGFATAGIYYLNPGGQWRSLVPQEIFSQILVNCLMEDNSGSIWAGLDGAQLDKIQPRNVRTLHLPASARQQVVRMACARRDGSVWVGTDGAGVFRYQDEKWSQYSHEAGLSNAYVGVIFEDQRTNLWVGTWDGLYRLKNEQFVPAWSPTPSPIQVRAMFEDREHNLWVGTSVGAIKIRETQSRAKVYEGDEAYAGSEILAIAQDASGTMWAAALNGLYRLNGERFERVESEFTRNRAVISSLLADADGGLWIGTLDRGFAYTKDGVSSSWTTQDGLPTDMILTVIEDKLGNLWFASDNGIIGFPKSRLHSYKRSVSPPLLCWQLSVGDGLDSRRCSGNGQPVAALAPNGALWVPNSHALAVFNPDELPQSGAIYPPLLEEALVDGAPVTPADAGTVRVSSAARGYEFHYSSPTLREAERLRFRVRLSNWDPGWVEADQKRVAYYGRLPPGDYEFQVMAGSPAGVWQESPQKLQLTVVPRFWERRSAQISGGLLVLGGSAAIIWAVARARLRRRLAQAEAHQTMERERRRIARDLHDDLGAGLAEVVLLGELARQNNVPSGELQTHLSDMTDKTRGLVAAMDEIVWTVNPRNDSIPNFASYTAEHARKFFKATTIHCRLDIPPELPALPLSAAVRHNLFLAVKEALHNVAKHSGAREVWLRMHYEAGEFMLEIEDDGKGFDPQKTSDAGDGLGNMNQRLESVGGHTEINSESGRGTKVRFVLRVQSAVS